MPTNNNLNAHDMERSMQAWIAEFERRMHEDLPASEREKSIAETVREREKETFNPNVHIDHKKQEIHIYTHFILYGKLVNDHNASDLKKYIETEYGETMRKEWDQRLANYYGIATTNDLDFSKLITDNILRLWNNVDNKGYGKYPVGGYYYKIIFHVTSEYKEYMDADIIKADKSCINQYWAIFTKGEKPNSNAGATVGKSGYFVLEQVLALNGFEDWENCPAHEYGHVLGLRHTHSVSGVVKSYTPYYEEVNAQGIQSYRKGGGLAYDLRTLSPDIMFVVSVWTDKSYRSNPDAPEPYLQEGFLYFPLGSTFDCKNLVVTEFNINSMFGFWAQIDREPLYKAKYKNWCLFNNAVHYAQQD